MSDRGESCQTGVSPEGLSAGVVHAEARVPPVLQVTGP
jgi:hypothetical protein